MFAPSRGHRYRVVLLPVVLALLLLSSTGCSKKGKATVKGTVSFAGQPLNAGTVTFVTADNRTGTGVIANDGKGSFTVPDAPLGEAKVFITIPKMPLGMGGPVEMPKPPKGMGATKPPSGSGMKAPPGMSDRKMPDPSTFVRIPEKYKKAETTDLTFTVVRGENTMTITLKP